jgi:tripartite-type tricarboxylate transporter receptor subunit TctC
MSTTSSARALRLCAAVLLSVIATPAGAQPWPAKPITIINGFPAGAGNDIVLRIYKEALEHD